jgi:hypothetical protein
MVQWGNNHNTQDNQGVLRMGMFNPANRKLKKLYKVPELGRWLSNKRKVFSFDLLSGHSCPFAKDCFSKVVKVDGRSKIQDGKDTLFRCFSASQEVMFPNVYNSRNDRFQELRTLTQDQLYNLILENHPVNMGICRIHVSGDFFNPKYFHAWLNIAESNPDILYYAYTKSLPYWVDCLDNIPKNFILTASFGGRCDHLIDEYGLRFSKVVNYVWQAEELALDIDFDDSHASIPEWRFISFALHIHGPQPAGTEGAKAVQEMRKNKTNVAYG